MVDTGLISRRSFAASGISAATVATLLIGAEAQALKAEEHAMIALTPYLLFDGNCHEAMEFYRSCFGGELTAIRVKDSVAKDQLPAFQQEKVINARLKNNAVDISASDWLRPDQTPVRGNMVCLYLSGGTFDELKRLFARLSEGGDVTDPLKEQFFGMYGALNDRFGVRWMFHANQQP